VSSEIRTLISNMAATHPFWGAPRVHGELLKLGYEISERTVSRLMPKKRQETIANVDNLSAESCGSNGLH
jgi:hypothetical protein